MHAQLTSRQQQVLDYMRAFHAENDQLPPMHNIAQHFGWKSDNAALTFALILEAKGYIEKNAVGRYRFTRPQPTAQSFYPTPAHVIRLLDRPPAPSTTLEPARDHR